jgi:CDP-6-deoxy-D-xylo-4-hexulose-3-dehydrase
MRTTDHIRQEISELVSEFASVQYAATEFKPGVTPIPASGKVIGQSELTNMVNAALDGWLTTGRFNTAFENQLADYLGVKHLITVNSGSSANLVAFNTLTSPKLGDRAIQKGDEVITVAAGFPTTVNPIIQFGAIPVFVDVELATYNIDTSQLEGAIGPRTKAIVLAHALGNPFNLQAVVALCRKYDLWLIEDCCDALGSTYNGQLVGTFGDIGTLSFYPAHHITMGEGGAVFTKSGKLKLIAESFRDWGRDCYCPPGEDNTCNNRFCWTAKQLGGSLPDGYDHKYIYAHAGYNLKITDMQAACGLAQLGKVKQFLKARRENFRYFMRKLDGLADHLVLPHATENSDPSWFGFPLTLRENQVRGSRPTLLQYLEKKKIGTRLLFGGNLVKQPYFKNNPYRIYGELKNTDLVMRNTFWLGLHPGIDAERREFISDSLLRYFE